MERSLVQSLKSMLGKPEFYTRVSKEALKKNPRKQKIPQGQLRKPSSRAGHSEQTSLVTAEQEIVRGGTPGRGDCWADTFLMKFKNKANIDAGDCIAGFFLMIKSLHLRLDSNCSTGSCHSVF